MYEDKQIYKCLLIPNIVDHYQLFCGFICGANIGKYLQK